jgi:hypothetical protein
MIVGGDGEDTIEGALGNDLFDDGDGVVSHSAAPDGSIYALTTDEIVYHYTDVEGGWDAISGAEVVSLSVAPDSSVYALTTSNVVYRYTGVANRWDAISGAEVVSLSVAPDCSVYGLTTSNVVYRYTGVANRWDAISGAEVVSLSVASDGSIYALTTSNIVYRYTGEENRWDATSDDMYSRRSLNLRNVNQDVPNIGIATPGKVREGEQIGYTISLSRPSPVQIRVTVSFYSIGSNSARNGEDYFGYSGYVWIPAGQTSITLFVNAVADTLRENTEYFFVSISDAFGAKIGSSGHAEKEIQITDANGGVVQPPIIIDPNDPAISKPAQPKNLRAATIRSTSIDFNFDDKSNNETKFQIVISTNGSDFDAVGSVPANSKSFQLKDLKPNTYYWVRIVAVNGSSKHASSTIQVRTKS